jgi:hypothetical protein
MYFEQVGAAIEAGDVGQTAIRKLSPMQFVIADLADAVSWSLVTGCGVAFLHGAITRLNAPQDTVTFTVGAVGVALLAPIVKDGIVSVLVDVGELWERRHTEPEPAEPDNTPIAPVIVQTRQSNGGATWKFYTPPMRRSGEPIPPTHIKAVARAMIAEKFVNFSLRHVVTDLGLMSDPDFRLFQSDLIARRWATKTPGNRVVIEPAGRAMLLKLATT